MADSDFIQFLKSEKWFFAESDVKDFIDYNPDTGAFTWKVDRGGGVKAGDDAGRSGRSGYRFLTLHNRTIKCSRLAIWFATGEMPTLPVDHINRNPSDDRLCNLRVVTQMENAQNKGVVSALSNTGLRGIYLRDDGRYLAELSRGHKRVFREYFSTLEDAYNALEKARAAWHSGYVPP